MTTSIQVRDFLPSLNGLHFDNDFPSEPDLTFGPIHIGDASNGLCGGMTYTVRDFFEASLPVPIDAQNPTPSMPLYQYIVRRLLDSFDGVPGVTKYLEWQGAGAQTQFRNTVTTEWPKIKAQVDVGILAPLGLMRVIGSVDPRELGKNHQVLVYAYDLSSAGAVTLHLYDPNHHDHDDVTLTFGTTAPDGPPDISFDVGGVAATGGEVTFGCFLTAYTHTSPPAVLTLATPRVVYRGLDGTVQELSLAAGGWSYGQPALPLHPATSAGEPMGYVSALDHTARVVYRDPGGHIRELSLAPGGVWAVGDLTVLTGAEDAVDDPWAYVAPSRHDFDIVHAPDEAPRVVYRSADGHLRELRLPIGASWTPDDLTADSGAPLAAGAGRGYVDPNDNSSCVGYRSNDDRVIELRLDETNVWAFRDLTATPNSTAAAGNPWGYVTPDGTLRVVYRGVDSHLHELSLPPGGDWGAGDLTVLTGMADIAGDPCGYVTLHDRTARVVFRDANGHICEVSLAPGSRWAGGDITVNAGGANAAGDPFGYTSYLDHVARVVYRDPIGHIHELSLAPGGTWFNADLTGRTGAPPAAGDPRGYLS